MKKSGLSLRVLRRSLGLIAALAALGVVPVEAADLDPSRIQWKSIRYRAKKLTFSLDSEVSIAVRPSSQVAADLVAAPEGSAVEAASESTVLLTFGAKGMGTTSETRVWLDSQSSVALQRTQISTSKKRRRHKTLRFTETGVQLFFRRPAPGEDEMEPATWTGGTTRLEAYPSWSGTDLKVTEPTALFYLLAVADLTEPGDQIQFPIFSDDNLILIEIKVVGKEHLKVDYVKETPSGSERVKGSVPVLKILVDGQHLDPDSQEGHFNFMGMKGDVDIYLDPETRAPLQISGKVPVAGRANVKIKHLVLE